MVQLNNRSALNDYRVMIRSNQGGREFGLLFGDDSVITKINFTERINSPDVNVKIHCRASNVIDVINISDEVTIFTPEVYPNGNIEQVLKHRVKVLDIEIDDVSNELILDCNNLGYMLERNDFFVMVNEDETSSQFIQRTAMDAGITIDPTEFVQTKFKHKARIFNKTSLYHIWQSLLINTMYAEDTAYFLRVTPNGLQLFRLNDDGGDQGVWIFEHTGEYANLLGARRKISIKDKRFANRVIPHHDEQVQEYPIHIAGGVGGEYEIQVNEESINQYGLFSTYIDVTHAADYEAMVERMKLIVSRAVPADRLTFRTYAINSIKPSDKIVIVSRNLQTSGYYYVEDISTDIAEGSYWHNIVATKYRNIPDLLQRRIEQAGSYSIPEQIAGVG